jgi:hypothetical protein
MIRINLRNNMTRGGKRKNLIKLSKYKSASSQQEVIEGSGFKSLNNQANSQNNPTANIGKKLNKFINFKL